MKFHMLVYLVTAAALWRLWQSSKQDLWWIVFVGLVLSVWSNRAVKAGVKVALRDLGHDDISEISNPAEEVMKSPDGAAIKFWMHAAVVINIATLIISIVGIILP